MKKEIMGIKNIYKKLKENKYARCSTFIILIILCNFLLSFIFGATRTTHLGCNIYVAIQLLGFYPLIITVIWIIAFYYLKRMIEKENPIGLISRCPVCIEKFEEIRTEEKTKLGLPSATYNYLCENCNTRIASKYPYKKWKVEKAGEGINQEFKWLYEGEILTKEEISIIAGGGHTEKAIQKLRVRALMIISEGHLDEIQNFEDDWITSGRSDVSYIIRDFNQFQIQLLPDPSERLFIVVENVDLGIYSTKENQPYIRLVDQGILFLTDKRIGFRSPRKKTDWLYNNINYFAPYDRQIGLRLINRKTPDYFVEVDGKLIEAIYEGIKNEIT